MKKFYVLAVALLAMATSASVQQPNQHRVTLQTTQVH